MNRKPQARDKPQIVALQHQEYSGPLPPPDALAMYDKIIPGAAERILKMAENEAAARHRREDKLTENEVMLTRNIVRSSYLGIFFAFASVVLLIALAYYALTAGYPAVATSIIVINLASVAGMFIFFRNRKAPKQQN
jgi:uncharacterized membrane protein